MRPSVRAARALAPALALLGLGGCTAIALPALGAAAVTAGAGSLVRAGTEYTVTGTAHRTFSVPLDTLHQVTVTTAQRLGLEVAEDEASELGRVIVLEGVERTFHVRLAAISAAMARVSVVVKQDAFRRDRATASEFLTQLERAVDAVAPFPSAQPLLRPRVP